ncbi:MAG: hypothetical protein BROFUL_03391 [Candidatus Brocadia fulgida]|uniref:Uncharacterized protein n=1 Tax=Candidatus Brocadia fulgida TaxID=380242 RepID=A0A0M2UQK5_9BACT|nr:MAG: hypothetical protein BROFUL_03391 [Candidatus Brocadia fulgida]
MLLSPAYYEKLYQQDKLTVSAGMSLALGAVTAAAMSLGAIRSRSSSTDGVVNDLAVLCFVIGLHAMLIGFAGWFAPLKWPGLMPPITLISFLLGTAALASGLWPGRKFSDSHTNKPSDHTD